MSISSRQTLRQQILKQRRNLTAPQRKHAAKLITHNILCSKILLSKQHIAFYMPTKNEVNLLGVLKTAAHQQKHCYLPVLHPVKKNSLWFCSYQLGDELIPNRFGILEPAILGKKLLPAWALDLVFVPLVGFDINKNRLGMGGGFYDRTFAFRKNQQRKKPSLIGIAYEFQKVPKLISASWDVSMDNIITEKNIY